MDRFVFVLLLCLLTCKNFSWEHSALSPNISYSGDHYYDDPVEYYNDDDHDSLKQVVEANYAYLIFLLGSREKVESVIYENIDFGHPRNYWSLDQAYFAIETALNKTENINQTTKQRIANVTSAIMCEMTAYINDTKLYGLTKSRQIIDCAIGRENRNIYFSEMESFMYEGRIKTCILTVLNLWWNLTNLDYTNKPCTLKDSMEAVTEISEVRYPLIEVSVQILQLKSDLLMTLSQQHVINQLNIVLCDGKSPPLCQIYQMILCDIFDYLTITEITKLVNKGIARPSSIEPEAFRSLLVIQKKVADVSIELSNMNFGRTNHYEEKAAKEMLDNYFGIVDSTIGSRSVEVWKKVPTKEIVQQFEEILLESENFAGCTSDKILNVGNRYNKLRKKALDVQMKHVYSKEELKRLTDGQHNSTHFDFGSLKIWTNDLSAKSNWNIIALYYKTFHETLNEIIGQEVDFFESNNTAVLRNQNIRHDILIGNGGIVSLSARTDNRKEKSISVVYRMEFENQSLFINDRNVTGRRCFSCRFLDNSAKIWKSTGCYVEEVNVTGLTCKCNHTTNFAAFMSPFEADFNMTKSQERWLIIWKYFGLSISAVCLFLSFILFTIARQYVKHDRMRVHHNLVIALLLVHLIQIGSEAAINYNTLCLLITLSAHYFLLAAFMWMLIEGIFLYFYVIQVFMLYKLESRKWMYVIGWFAPLVIVGISAGYGVPLGLYVQASRVNNSIKCEEGEFLYPPHDSDKKYSTCWLSASSGMTWAFVGPALIVIALNTIIFCKVLLVLVKKSKKDFGTFSPSTTYSYEAKTRFSNEEFSSCSAHPKSHINNEETSWNSESVHTVALKRVGNSSPTTCPIRCRHFKSNYSSSSMNLPANTSLADVKIALKSFAVLLPLLGIPWIIGFFGNTSFALTFSFIVLVSFQGPAIFFIHCLFNKEVTRAFRRCTDTYWTNSYQKKSKSSSTKSLKSVSCRGKKNKKGSTVVTTISRSTNGFL